VFGKTFADHRARRDVEGGEQARCPIALVIMRAPFNLTGAQR
jgi:hypothetical protein